MLITPCLYPPLSKFEEELHQNANQPTNQPTKRSHPMLASDLPSSFDPNHVLRKRKERVMGERKSNQSSCDVIVQVQGLRKWGVKTFKHSHLLKIFVEAEIAPILILLFWFVRVGFLLVRAGHNASLLIVADSFLEEVGLTGQ